MQHDPNHCTLCPRACGGIRTDQQGKGFCQMPNAPMLARAALHQWEEPPISGTRGAGTIFFSGCSLRCVYCQNYSISQENYGQVVTSQRLREIYQELIRTGAHNIDLVNPTHFAHAILESLREPLSIPVIWNSGGYDRVETLQALTGKIAIYLPDFKYPDEEGAEQFSSAANYPTIAKTAIQEMVRQTGPYRLDEDGILQTGVMIRHLILPGRLRQAKEVMDWVARTFPPHTVLFSLMSQYVPLGHANANPALNRSLRPSEIRAAIDYMAILDLDGYTQDTSAAVTDYVPAFDLTGISSYTT